MTQSWKDYAAADLYGVLKSRRSIYDCCNRYLNVLDTRAGIDAAAGLIEALLGIVVQARASGLSFSVDTLNGDLTLFAIEVNRAFEGRQFESMAKSVALLISAVDSLNTRGLLAFPDLVKSEQPAAIDVRIVEMPARKTTTVIERDENGNLAGAYQLETNAV